MLAVTSEQPCLYHRNISRCFKHVYTNPPSPRSFHVTLSSIEVNVKVMRAYGRIRGMDPLIPKPGARWKCVVNITPRPLYHRLSLRYPLYRRLCGPQSLSGSFWRTENCLALLRIRTPNRPSRNPVAIRNV